MPSELEIQSAPPAATPAAQSKAAPIDQNTLQNLFVPLTREILKDMFGNTPNGKATKATLAKYLNKEETITETDRIAFEGAYFQPRMGRGERTEFTADQSFRKQFCEAFFETYERKRQLSGKYSADLLYAPDDKGNFSAEAERRILYFSFEIVQAIEDKKIGRLITDKKTTGTEAQLNNGNLRLFVNQSTGDVVALTEEDAKKDQNMQLVPYLAFNLRDKAAGQNAPPADPMARHFADGRASAAQRLLEKQGLIVTEPLKVDANGDIRGKVMASGKDKTKDGPILNTRVRRNLLPYVHERDQNQLRFDFNFENKDNIDASCPNEFFLYTGDLQMFKDPETGLPRPADEVAQNALEHNGAPIEFARARTMPIEQRANLEPSGAGMTTRQGEMLGSVRAAAPELESLVSRPAAPPISIASTLELTQSHVSSGPTSLTGELGGRASNAKAEEEEADRAEQATPPTTRQQQQQLAQRGGQGPGTRPGGPNRFVEEQPASSAKKRMSPEGKVAWATGGATAGATALMTQIANTAQDASAEQAAKAAKAAAGSLTFLFSKSGEIIDLIHHVIGKFHA